MQKAEATISFRVQKNLKVDFEDWCWQHRTSKSKTLIQLIREKVGEKENAGT
jgi:hypothetical protein